ncbi:MAG: uL15m family ribosomal protein [Candidatus Aenigmatarchaeota archaeon]
MGNFKRKKCVGQRGGRTYGWGNPKKHRNKGSRGGKGRAGNMGHKMTGILKNEPWRIGVKGFNAKTPNRHKGINLRDVDRLAGKEKAIDLGKFGYGKLLGRGEIARALEIKVDFFSKKAKEKVEAAGGKVVSDVPAKEKKSSGEAKKAAEKTAE